MSTSAAANSDSDRDAVLARLTGPQLVEHLGGTFRRADYAAAARVLDARDRRLARAEADLAQAKAALAEVQPGLAQANARVDALREEFLALKAAAAASHGPIGRPSPAAISAPAPRAGGRAEAASMGGVDVVDLCDSSDDDGGGGEEWEEGEFRPDGAAVSRKGKEPAAPDGGEGRRARVSRKRKATPVQVSDDDDDDDDEEDDRIPLSQFFQKWPGGKLVPNAEPKKGHGDVQKGHGDVQANSGQPSGDHPPEKLSVCKGDLKASAGQEVAASQQLTLATTVLGRGAIRQSGEGAGLSRAMPTPPPTDPAVGNRPRKNSSKVDGAQERTRIGDKQGSVDVPPLQVRTPSFADTARRIVGSARAAADEIPMEHNGSLQRNGIAAKTCVVPSAFKEQQKTQGQVLKTDVLPGTLVLHSQQMQRQSSLPSADTSHWESSSDVYTSCVLNREIRMQAVCALLRQKKLTIEGGRSPYTVLSKFDVHRAAALAEFLLDGNIQGPMKRTAEELEKHDSRGPDLIERVALAFSEQLLNIYRNKEDPYFR